MASLSYQGVHLALLAALPELQPCFDRLISDWGTSEGQPLGQYPTFEDTYSVWVKALVGLAAKDEGARALLQRAIDFAEQMLSSDDGEVVGLGIDSCAEWLDIMLGGRELAREMGGPALRRWMSTYSRDDWERTDQEIIDLWGVREVIAGLLPQVPLPEIPGITQPADHHRLGSLAEARANADGAVVLCAYGKSGLFVLARASAVNCDDGHLAQMALELAPVHRPGDRTVMDRGGPTTLYFEVPSGERVWNMTVGADEHGRLTPRSTCGSLQSWSTCGTESTGGSRILTRRPASRPRARGRGPGIAAGGERMGRSVVSRAVQHHRSSWSATASPRSRRDDAQLLAGA